MGTMHFGRRLQTKIFSMMLVVGVFPLFAAGGLVSYSLLHSHRANVASIEESILRQKQKEIVQAMEDIVENVFNLVVEQENKSDISIGSQHFLLRSFLADQPALEEVSFISLGGQTVATRTVAFEGRNTLEDIVTLEGEETVRYGRSRATHQPVVAWNIGEQVTGENRVQGRIQRKLQKFLVASNGEIYFGPTYHTLEGPVITVASPVKNRSGDIISVLSGELNLLRVQQAVANVTLGNTGYLYLVDQDGFLIEKSNGRPTEQSLKSILLVSDVLHGNDALGAEAQARYVSFFGDSVVAAGAALPEFGWALIAEWPVDDADRPVRDILAPIITFLFFALFAVAVLSVFFARRILDPIHALEAGTKRIAEGKFTEPIFLTTGDEIEELGFAFNDMMKGLKRLQELKDEFVFVAAHELRTPVAAIKGYLSLLLEGISGPLSDPAKSVVVKVLNANTRLIRLVDDLLQVARSEAGRLTITVKPTEITAPIRETLVELKPLADQKGIVLAYNPAPVLPQVRADTDRVREIMVNLVGNAIKYTLGNGTVTITHELQEGTLVTHITDIGIGIAKEAQQKIFEKFYRVQTEKTKSITGTGLGLFIVKQLVEKMGGTIWFTSEEGKGSVFSFSLPRA